MFLTIGSPMPPASSAIAGATRFTSALEATLACVAVAPIVTPLPSALIALRSAMAPRSTRRSDCDRRSRIAWIRLWPPARKRVSAPLAAALAASRLVGRWYSNAYMLVLLASGGEAVGGAPDALRRRRHRQVDDPEGVGEGVDVGRRRADRAGLAA